MTIFGRLFAHTPPERREALAQAVERTIPNSYEADVGTGNPGRLIAGARRIKTRNMDELIGMCRMVLADGAVNDNEARFLLNWIEENLHAVREWPGNILYERIVSAMVDGKIDPEEERELLEMIHKVSGGVPGTGGPAVSGAVPYDDPAPPIVHEGRSFVVTGQFVYGPRRKVQQEIEERGGTMRDGCSKKTHYLVIGTFGSEEWLHSTHGTKIIKAVQLKKAGIPVAIVSEKHWTTAL